MLVSGAAPSLSYRGTVNRGSPIMMSLPRKPRTKKIEVVV